MALVVPLASSASVIENILFKVRRGIALSRNASQANPNTGVMVDLPEKIDFEMTLLKTHQSPSFQRVTGSTASDNGGDSRASVSSESSKSNKLSYDIDSTLSGELSGSSDCELSDRSTMGSEASHQNVMEHELSSDIDSSCEKSSGKGMSSSGEASQNSNLSQSAENESRCTMQDQNANREYDKFDTDTGKIEGISI